MRVLVNQISFPLGDQPNPQAVSQPVDNVFFFPERSTTAIDPASSLRTGCSMKATKSPLRLTRGWLSHPPVWYSTFPMGYSSRLNPPNSRTTAKLDPSGDQSAHCTFSSTSRGAPPPSGTLPNVPSLM